MENCKGCCRKPCTYSEYIEECPCGICLIKGICRIACDDFIDFVVEKGNADIGPLDTSPPYKPINRSLKYEKL
jgi:hypothetical protein